MTDEKEPAERGMLVGFGCNGLVDRCCPSPPVTC